VIFSAQQHRELICSPLSPSHNERVTVIRAENQRIVATLLCNSRKSWGKITIASLTEVIGMSKMNLRHERKVIFTLNIIWHILYTGPIPAWSIFTNLSWNTARPEKPCPTCNFDVFCYFVISRQPFQYITA